MRHSMFTIAVISIMAAAAYSQWNILNKGLSQGNYCFDFVNDQIGWIAGNQIGWIDGRGTLLKTEDGGETWISLPIEENYEMQMIDFIDENVGYAVASDSSEYMILKSQDGGFTWLIQKKVSDITLNAFHVNNDSVVYIIGYYGRNDEQDPWNGIILKSSDGGTNWIDVSPDLINKRLYSVRFFEPDVGVITGYYERGGEDTRRGLILKTIDGGNTWNEIIVNEFQLIDKLQIINDSTGYFEATKNYGDIGSFLYTTTDTFNTWTIKTNEVNSYFILDDKTIFTVISDTVKKSTDGGISWEIAKIQFENAEVSIVNSDTAYLLGYKLFPFFGRKFLWKTTNGGDDWSELFFSDPLNDVWFFNGQKGVLCAGATWRGHMGSSSWGYLYFTNDGGITWDLDIKVTNGNILKCFFINDFTGYIISKEGASKIIYKTVDGGVNWNLVYENNSDSTGYFFWINDITFINMDVGWAVGGAQWSNGSRYLGAGILGTKDGGENWDLVWKYPNTDNHWYRLRSIHSVDTKAWAVGESGLIVISAGIDSFIVINSFTDLPLNEVFFSDAQHGWIAGGYFDEDNIHLKLFKTKDAGQTWQEISDFNYQINDMFFVDSLKGWAVGCDTSGGGIILETADGGENWNVLFEDLSAPLNALHFKDGYGWAVGGNGLVLRTDDGITWIDQSSGKTYPSKYVLHQNYPNPFNPKTVINYQLSINSKVDLSIYNILGQKVSTLVSKKQTAGTYDIEWNATGFASGLYYYRLKTNTGFVQTRKLILLK